MCVCVFHRVFVNVDVLLLIEPIRAQYRDYRSLAEFFTRPLKENARLIDAASCLVSPADGKVLHFGPASSEQVEQVGGANNFVQIRRIYQF